MEFQDKIKEIRTHLDISQDEFGKLLGLSQKIISDYEKGRRRPSYNTLVALTELTKKHKIRISLI